MRSWKLKMFTIVVEVHAWEWFDITKISLFFEYKACTWELSDCQYYRREMTYRSTEKLLELPWNWTTLSFGSWKTIKEYSTSDKESRHFVASFNILDPVWKRIAWQKLSPFGFAGNLWKIMKAVYELVFVLYRSMTFKTSAPTYLFEREIVG